MKTNNLIGQRFKHLQVIDYNEDSKKWICKCDCGKTTEVKTSNLTSGNTKSCGCMKNAVGTKRKRPIKLLYETIGMLYVMNINESTKIAKVKCLNCNNELQMEMEKLIEMKKKKRKTYVCGVNGCTYKRGNVIASIKIGEKYNHLTILKRVENSRYICRNGVTSTPKYLCKCDCGTTLNVEGRAILNGNTKSCGCLRKMNFNNAQKIKKPITDIKTTNSTKDFLYNLFFRLCNLYKNPTENFKKNFIDKNIKFFPELRRGRRGF